MIYVLYFLHVVVCLFLILVVLVQQGKGADLSVFGGGATMTAFGARGATTLLHKLTVGAFVLFILTTLGIAVIDGSRSRSSVMSGIDGPRGTATTAAPAAAATTEAAGATTTATPTPVEPPSAPPSQ